MKIVVIGAGEVGFHIAKKLAFENKDVVLVEKSEVRARRVRELLDVQVIHGKGSSPSILKDAGLSSAEIMIAVTDSDETNIVACLIGQTLCPNIIRVARLRDPEYRGEKGIVDKSGLSINLMISPEEEVAKSIGLLAETPGASDVLQFAGGRVKLIGVKVENGSRLVGKSLVELADEAEQKILVAAIYHNEKAIVPRGDTRISDGDTLFLVTLPEAERQVLSRCGKHCEPTRRAIVSSGSRIGECVARRLAEKGIHTKIIEKSRARAEHLAGILDKVAVLHGEGTDQHLLAEEGVRDVDMFISTAADEEENVLTALLAKRLGAKRAVSLVDTTEYIPLASTIGVDVVLSPMLAAVSTILQFVRQGKILSVSTLREELVEAIEFVAMETSDIVDKPLSRLSIPKGAMIGSIVRDDKVIIPDGKTIIHAGDRVIVFARPDTISKMEKAMKVNLEYF